jgi:phage shock protein A
MPGILERIKNIVSANVNVMLDKAEDPEKMLQEFLRQAQSSRGEVREEMVDARAELLILERRQRASDEQARKWGLRAEQAVKEGNDDLAKQALKRQKSFEEVTAEWMSQVEAQKQAVQNLESASKQLSDRIEEAEIRLSSLVSRHKAALATVRLEKVLQGVGETAAAISEFGRMEDRVDREEAKAQALAQMSVESVEEKYRALAAGDEEAEIDARLEELKRRLKEPGGSAQRAAS